MNLQERVKTSIEVVEQEAVTQMEQFVIDAIENGQVKILEVRGGKFLTPQESVYFHQQISVTEWYLSLPKPAQYRLRLEDQLRKTGEHVRHVLFHRNGQNGSSHGVFPDLDMIYKAGLSFDMLTPDDLDYLRGFVGDTSLMLFISDGEISIQDVVCATGKDTCGVADEFGRLIQANDRFAQFHKHRNGMPRNSEFGQPGNGMMVNFTGISDGGIPGESYSSVENLLELVRTNASQLVSTCMDHIKVTTRGASFVVDWNGEFSAYELDEACHWSCPVPLSQAVHTMTGFLRPESSYDLR